jgi:hypothetical protein
MQNSVMVLETQLGKLTHNIMPYESRARHMVNEPSVVIGLPVLRLRVAIGAPVILDQLIIEHLARVMEECRQVELDGTYRLTQVKHRDYFKPQLNNLPRMTHQTPTPIMMQKVVMAGRPILELRVLANQFIVHVGHAQLLGHASEQCSILRCLLDFFSLFRVYAHARYFNANNVAHSTNLSNGILGFLQLNFLRWAVDLQRIVLHVFLRRLLCIQHTLDNLLQLFLVPLRRIPLGIPTTRATTQVAAIDPGRGGVPNFTCTVVAILTRFA